MFGSPPLRLSPGRWGSAGRTSPHRSENGIVRGRRITSSVLLVESGVGNTNPGRMGREGGTMMEEEGRKTERRGAPGALSGTSFLLPPSSFRGEELAPLEPLLQLGGPVL